MLTFLCCLVYISVQADDCKNYMYVCMWKGTNVFSLFGFRGGRINLPNNIIKWNSTENSLYSIMVRWNQFILWLQIPILGFVWGATNLNNVSNLGRRDFADLFGEQKKNWNIIRIRNQLNLYLDKWFICHIFCFALYCHTYCCKNCQPHSLSDLICLFIRISKKKSTANQYAWIAKWEKKSNSI